MIGIDTNILVYTHRKDMSFHVRADQFVSGLVNDSTPIGIPYPYEIKTFYSADRDFNRFPKLKIKNPLV